MSSTIDPVALVNEVDLGAVAGLAAKIQETPSVAATVWQADVRWTGGFRSEASVRRFTGLPSDEPAALGGTDLAPNPVEQLLAALGNCLAVGYAANATAAGIEIRDLTIHVEGDLDLHTFLGLRPEGNAGFGAVRVSVDLQTDAPPHEVAELHRRVAATSPVGHTLSRAVPLDITW